MISLSNLKELYDETFKTKKPKDWSSWHAFLYEAYNQFPNGVLAKMDTVTYIDTFVLKKKVEDFGGIYYQHGYFAMANKAHVTMFKLKFTRKNYFDDDAMDLNF